MRGTDDSLSMNRRSVVAAVGFAAITGISGCLGSDDSGEGETAVPDTSTETETAGATPTEPATADSTPTEPATDATPTEVTTASPDESGIVAVVDNYLQAFDAGDYDGILALTHSEGPEEESVREVGESSIQSLGDQYTFELVEATVVSNSAGEATVDVTYTRSDETVERDVELRTESGVWKIWEDDA
ncbi:hypothetical protein [Haloarcula laminariae]|uniref:hypothetical protein n=1 Tax=Haloarcula laminariae TaxID=2961577 RepID=UPI0024068E2D|nr:hypothetical protein [Halomicroarcula sp. FL173]